MAYVGLARPYISQLINEVAKQYSGCFKCGKAMSVNITPNYNEAKLYADNQLAEYVKEFKDGTFKLGTDRLPKQAKKICFGHTVEGDEVTYKTGDTANYVGVGFYVDEMLDGVKQYVATIVYKAKFTEGAEDYTTKGENIEFKTPALEGTIAGISSTEWKKTKAFQTELEAETWIQTILGYAPSCGLPVADVQAGAYEDEQTVTLTAGAGETIYYTDNGTTPSAENGKEYTAPIVVSETCAIKAIAVKEGSNDSEIVTFEYFIG